jgi:arylsulfatase A-like enzyme
MANGKLKMLRTHGWKYVHAPAGQCELYDLHADPDELVNLADAPPHRERVQDFRRQLLDWSILSEDTLPPL